MFASGFRHAPSRLADRRDRALAAVGCALRSAPRARPILPSSATSIAIHQDRPPVLQTATASTATAARSPRRSSTSTTYHDDGAVVEDHPHWATVLEKLTAKEMPPKDAEAAARPPRRGRQVIDWIKAVRRSEAEKNAGDPGIVLARRLSNAEYNYTIRDLTGVDIRPTREFPVDPANPAGFDNSGESLAMSPALLNKYLQAAREVANHMVLQARRHRVRAAPDAGRDRSRQVLRQQDHRFLPAAEHRLRRLLPGRWAYKHRAALGKPDATLADVAAERKVSPKYLATVWSAARRRRRRSRPAREAAQRCGASCPRRTATQPDVAQRAATRCATASSQLREKVEPRFTNLAAGRHPREQPADADVEEPAVRDASHDVRPRRSSRSRAKSRDRRDDAADDERGRRRQRVRPRPHAAGEEQARRSGPGRSRGPARAATKRRSRSSARSSPTRSTSPSAAATTSTRSKDNGRYLSAGFHNVMGYFRDDQPLYELILDEEQQKELDDLWQELDFIASGNIRTYVQFYFNESGEARGTSRESEGPRPKDLDVTSERMIKELEADVPRAGARRPAATTPRRASQGDRGALHDRQRRAPLGREGADRDASRGTSSRC